MRSFRTFAFLLLFVMLAQQVLQPLSASAAADPRQRKPEASRSAASFSTGRAATLSDAQRYRYQLRHRYTYSWNLDVLTSSFSEDESGVERGDSTPITANGTVELIPVQQTAAGGHVVQVKVTDPHVWGVEDGVAVDAMTRELAADLARPFYFVQSPTGAVEYIVYATNEPAASQNLKRSIVSSLQVQLDAAPAGEAVETEPNGVVTTSYELVARGDVVAITTQRDEDDFIRFSDPAITDGSADIAAQQTALFDPGLGSLREVTFSDRIATVAPGDAPYAEEGIGSWSSAEAQGGLTLNSVSSAPVTDRLPSFSSTATQDVIVASISRATGGAYQAGSLLALAEPRREQVDPNLDLRTALAELAAQPDTFAPVEQLSSLLTSDAAHLDELARLLPAGAVDSALYPRLSVALAAVANPQAQDLIVALALDQSLAEPLRNDILLSLLQVAAPSPNTVAAVLRLSRSTADPLASQGVLVLGGLLNSLAASDPAAAAAGARELERDLAATADEARVELYLTALGNAADADSLPVLTANMGHGSANVRLAALDGLRKFQPKQVSDLVLKATGDEDPQVAFMAEEMLADMNIAAQSPSPLQAGVEYPSKPWEKVIGGGDVYARLHLELKSSKPNGFMMLNAEAGVDIHLWKIHKNNVVKAQAMTKAIHQARRFSFYLYVMGNKVLSKDYDITCETVTGKKSLYNKDHKFFDAYYGWQIRGLGLGLSVKVGGGVGLSYELAYKNCGGNTLISTTLTPHAYIFTKGGVFLNIGLIGASLEASIQFLNTELPATARVQVDSQGLWVGYEFGIKFTPISAKLIGSYWRWSVLKWDWIYKYYTLWSKSHPGYEKPLFKDWWLVIPN